MRLAYLPSLVTIRSITQAMDFTMEVLITVAVVVCTLIVIVSMPLRNGAQARVNIGAIRDQLSITTIRPNRLMLRIITATLHTPAIITTIAGIIITLEIMGT